MPILTLHYNVTFWFSRAEMSDPNSFPFCYPAGYFFQNFYESYPYRNSTTPVPQASTDSSQPGQSSGSSQSESSGSGTSAPIALHPRTRKKARLKQHKTNVFVNKSVALKRKGSSNKFR